MAKKRRYARETEIDLTILASVWREGRYYELEN